MAVLLVYIKIPTHRPNKSAYSSLKYRMKETHFHQLKILLPPFTSIFTMAPPREDKGKIKTTKRVQKKWFSNCHGHSSCLKQCKFSSVSHFNLKYQLDFINDVLLLPLLLSGFLPAGFAYSVPSCRCTHLIFQVFPPREKLHKTTRQ